MSNFLHILETVTRALNYHLEYELALLPREGDLTVEAWADLRHQADAIFAQYEELLKLQSDFRKCLSASTPRHTLDPSQIFADSAHNLHAFRDHLLLGARERLDHVVTARRVRRLDGSLISPWFFPSDVFAGDNWRGYGRRVERLLPSVSN